MKKKELNLIIAFSFTLLFSQLIISQSQFSSAPQWNGPNNSTGTIYRSGNVGIGNTGSNAFLTVGDDNNGTASLFRMGKIINTLTGDRLFNFASTASSNLTAFNFYSMNNTFALRFQSSPSNSFLGLQDYTGTEVLKAARESSLGSYIHMPQADSKIVIGDYAGYLQAEGHKLIVKDGSAKIEGDIITDSRIGIGTNSFDDGSDSYKLSVNGRVRAEAIKVYTNWADYVFEADYELPTLQEVEKHIETYGHLKDIPSATEVEANGIELGEMNKLLLQKIEELTLYVIALNKELKALKN